MSNSPDAFDKFINVTEKSTVAVIIPMFGYWDDVPDNKVNGEVLATVLSRVYSNVHHLYLIFVANPKTLPNHPKDPNSVVNVMRSKMTGGNVVSVPVERDASYAEYLREGLDCAINDTNAQFMVVLNPWVLIQHGGIDVLVDRANTSDDAKVVSGYSVQSLIDQTQEAFDQYTTSMPVENWDTNFDFLCMPRFAAELARFDEKYQTKEYMQLDLFQMMRHQGFAVIASERCPIFTFDFPWDEFVPQEAYVADEEHFKSKWGFSPGLQGQHERKQESTQGTA